MIIEYTRTQRPIEIEGNGWTGYRWSKHNDTNIFHELWNGIEKYVDSPYDDMYKLLKLLQQEAESKAYCCIIEDKPAGIIDVTGTKGVLPKILIEKNRDE